MNPKCTRQPRWIGTDAEVAMVQEHLKQQDEIAIDFENNNDHSYLGTDSKFIFTAIIIIDAIS